MDSEWTKWTHSFHKGFIEEFVETDSYLLIKLKDGFKRCNGCARVLPTDKFHRCANAISGFKSRCKDCRKEDAKRYRARFQ